MRHPYRLQCEQYKLARLATQKLMESPNGHVLFNHQLLNFEQDGDQVTVYAEGPLEIHRFCADYLIGADGSNSTVRKSIKVGFDGFTYDERFLTLSTAYPLEDHFENLAKLSKTYFGKHTQRIQNLYRSRRLPRFWITATNR